MPAYCLSCEVLTTVFEVVYLHLVNRQVIVTPQSQISLTKDGLGDLLQVASDCFQPVGQDSSPPGLCVGENAAGTEIAFHDFPTIIA